MYSMFALMMAAFTLTGCEDVPAPYDIPEGGVGGGGETTLKAHIWRPTSQQASAILSQNRQKVTDQ